MTHDEEIADLKRKMFNVAGLGLTVYHVEAKHQGAPSDCIALSCRINLGIMEHIMGEPLVWKKTSTSDRSHGLRLLLDDQPDESASSS